MSSGQDAAEYETRAMAWLLSEVREILHEFHAAGVPTDSSRRVAGNYLFGLACRLDGTEGDGAVQLCFLDGDELLRPGPEVALHEYVLGTVDDELGL